MDHPTGAGQGAAAAGEAAGFPPGGVSERLSRLGEAAGADGSVRVGTVVDGMGPAGVGLLLALLGIPAMLPSPGLPVGMLFGAAISLAALQLLFGAQRLTLPAWLRRRTLPQVMVTAMSGRAARALAWVERRMRPRLGRLTGRVARRLLSLVLLALGVMILLPIPFGNQPPALAVIVFGLAFAFRDGAAVVVALALSLAAAVWTALVVVFGVQVLAWLWGALGLA
ncbi:exopolysaccharide biosynthesis protein [Paroceanicella profunda]|uniref:exopolysaccharide biosynthesis protein n=1 Tax=Paroceanicella profunda TaxID=2579971 RepID=UPI001478CF29|nr:exopolysaccharide biosynthesis protein [Paroceanicella profunda]